MASTPASFTRTFLYLWALPTTSVGLACAAAALVTGGRARVVRGVIEVHGGIVGFLLHRVAGIFLAGGASAMTLGHVVLGRDQNLLDFTRDHERVHVRQCERWGPLFLPVYLGASAWLWFRGRRRYEDNPFEVEAYDRSL